MKTISRRRAMQIVGAGAVALGTPFGKVGKAFAARDKEMNILCWEGYNSAQVLDPFRKKEDATVKAESLTNDPTMINRLRAGETNVWDLINVNNPWARKVMWPAKLIKPLPRDQFEPYFEKMLPEFKPPYKWAMSDDGKELLGMAQRFGPYSFVVNTDKISRKTAEEQGWDLFNDPKLAGRYGIQESDDWNVFDIFLIAGINPFKEHSEDEMKTFKDTAVRIFKGAKKVGDMAGLNQGLDLRRNRSLSDRRHLFGLPRPRRRLSANALDHAAEGSDRWQRRRGLDRDHLDRQQSGPVAARAEVLEIRPGAGGGAYGRLRRRAPTIP